MTEQEWLASEHPTSMLEWLTVTQGPSGYYVRHDKQIRDHKLRMFACAVAERCGKSRVEVEEVADSFKSNSKELLAWAMRWADPNAPTWIDRRDPNKPTQKDKANLLRCVIGNPYRPVYQEDRGYPKSMNVVVLSTSLFTTTILQLAEVAYHDQPGRKCDLCFGDGEIDMGPGPMAKCGSCYGTGTISDGSLDPLTLMLLADALEEAGCVGTSHPCLGCGGHGTLMQAAPDRGPEPICDICDGSGTKCWPHPILTHLRSPGPHVRGCWVLDLILGKE